MGAAVLLLVFGGVAACGDDDDSDSSSSTSGTSATGDDAPAETEASDDGLREDYVEAIVAIAGDDDIDSFPPEARQCVAESFVDGFGAEEIAAAGVTPDDITSGEADGPGDLGLDFSDDQADAFYEQMTGCLDLRELLVNGILGVEGDVPPEVAACFDENLSDDLLQRFFTTGFTQGDAGFEENPEVEEEFNSAVTPCMALGEE
jgi:hypothetical protein